MSPSPIITARSAFRPDKGTGILAGHNFVAIDLETTGVGSEHRICEIGAVRMRPDGTVLDVFSQIVNPGPNVPLPAAAQRVHQITPGEIRSAPPIDTALGDLVDFIGHDGLVAHNASFENRFLSAAYERRGGPQPAWQGICTLKMARAYLSANSYKLTNLLTLLEIDAVNSHRAADDAHACGLLAAYLISTLNVSALEPVTNRPAAPEPGAADSHTAAVGLLTRGLGATVIAAGAVSPTASLPATDTTIAEPPLPAIDRVRKAFGGHRPTDEQQAAVERFQSGGSVKLIARAGTGKTHTIRALARLEAGRNPGRRFLYVAFNRSVADDAARTFPQNTTVRTAHALARRGLASTAHGPLLAKLGADLPKWRTTADAIMPRRTVVDLPSGARLLSEYVVGRHALETVKEFCRTLDERIDVHHLPAIPGIAPGSVAEHQLADAVIPCARRAWKHLMDPDSFAVPFQHDTYLHLWVVTRPRIGNEGDVLGFDEAQDAAPPVMRLVEDQTHLQRLYVGDPAQAIYGFTGAVDSLARFRADHTATLTQSFRFGDAIAESANRYLTTLGETTLVRGNPDVDDVVDHALQDTDAVLARTNAGALAELIASQKAGRKTALIGNRKASLKFCESARTLLEGRSPSDPKFAAFSTWLQLEEYVENQPDASEIATQVKLVNENGVDVVENALQNLVSPERSDLTAITAHKGKGLEFDRVRIAADFEVPGQHNGPHAPDKDEVDNERRLAYVALTRARTHLNPGALIDQRDVTSVRTAPAGMLL